jgi:hypothetical protein
LSQQYPQQPGWGGPQQPGWGTPPPPPPKKNSTGKTIGLGCAGVFALLVIIGIIGAALGGGSDDSSSKGSTVSSGATAKDNGADEDTEAEAEAEQEEPAEEEPEPDLPVKVTAKETAFAPSILADGSNYTSVKVTVTNNSDDTISVNPLYFAITDSKGTKHSHKLAADENQIDTVKLAPGENVSGSITGEGKFTPEYVTYTDSWLGDSVRVAVS